MNDKHKKLLSIAISAMTKLDDERLELEASYDEWLNSVNDGWEQIVSSHRRFRDELAAVHNDLTIIINEAEEEETSTDLIESAAGLLTEITDENLDEDITIPDMDLSSFDRALRHLKEIT